MIFSHIFETLPSFGFQEVTCFRCYSFPTSFSHLPFTLLLLPLLSDFLMLNALFVSPDGLLLYWSHFASLLKVSTIALQNLFLYLEPSYSTLNLWVWLSTRYIHHVAYEHLRLDVAETIPHCFLLIFCIHGFPNTGHGWLAFSSGSRSCEMGTEISSLALVKRGPHWIWQEAVYFCKYVGVANSVSSFKWLYKDILKCCEISLLHFLHTGQSQGHLSLGSLQWILSFI